MLINLITHYKKYDLEFSLILLVSLIMFIWGYTIKFNLIIVCLLFLYVSLMNDSRVMSFILYKYKSLIIDKLYLILLILAYVIFMIWNWSLILLTFIFIALSYLYLKWNSFELFYLSTFFILVSVISVILDDHMLADSSLFIGLYFTLSFLTVSLTSSLLNRRKS
jgi:hypothetical protein